MPGSVEFDDLVGYGVFGLFDAIEKFDPTKHVKFKTYAVTRIRGAIFDELRSNDWVPRSVRQKAREVEDTVRQLEATLGRAATDAELAREMNLPLKEFQQLLLKISSTAVMSLNDLWHSGDDSDRISIAESVESPASLNPDTIVEKDEIKRVMLEAPQGASGKGTKGSGAVLLRGADTARDWRGAGGHRVPGVATAHQGDHPAASQTVQPQTWHYLSARAWS